MTPEQAQQRNQMAAAHAALRGQDDRLRAIECSAGPGFGGRGLALPRGRRYSGRRIWAKITADVPTKPGVYTWREQRWDEAANGGLGWWADWSFTSSELGPAWEVGGLDAVAVGEIVELTDTRGSAGSGLWMFRSPRPWIWVKLTSSAAVPGGANRWYYGGRRQVRTGTAFADFSPTLDIIAGSETKLINAMEAFNNGTGPEGNGVDHTLTTASPPGTFPATFAMKPLNTGTPVVTAQRERLGDGTLVWTVQSPNADDGGCG